MRAKIKHGLRQLGLQVRGVEPDLVDFLISRRVDTVIDVGANIGQFGTHIRARGYRGRIASFEPVSVAYKILEEKTRRDPSWDIFNFALGSEEGTSAIKVSEYSVFSSILPQRPKAIQFDSRARVVAEEKIDVKTLDGIFDRFRDGRVFLKIDTQGYEQAVLEGSKESMPHVLGLHLELPIAKFYEGTWELPEALVYLRQKGFVLCQSEPTNYDPHDPVAAVELDCLFRREYSGEAVN